MAKIVLNSSPPDAEIAAALQRVDHLLASQRGRDQLAVASLTSCRKHLRIAHAEIELVKRHLAARCRQLAAMPPIPAPLQTPLENDHARNRRP